MKEHLKKILPKSLINLTSRNTIPTWNGKDRVFCISFQRTGTTSFGDFFDYFNFPRAGYQVSKKYKWSKLHFEEKDIDIFNSKEFNKYQVFEDNPWWNPGFYKVLYNQFPTAKFVLIERDSASWFSSMKKHSNGKTLGNTRRHAKIYKREVEFENRIKNDPTFKPTDDLVDNLLDLEGWDDHYIKIYENHIMEVKKFFNNQSPESLLVVNLTDQKKWQKIANFIGFEIPENFKMHSNQSK